MHCLLFHPNTVAHTHLLYGLIIADNHSPERPLPHTEHIAVDRSQPLERHARTGAEVEGAAQHGQSEARAGRVLKCNTNIELRHEHHFIVQFVQVEHTC